MSRLFLNGAACAAALLFSAPAFAHVTLEQKEATSGTFYKGVLRVPHGCGDAATTSIKVSIPEGVVNVKPQPKPGWTLATETGPYEKSYAVMHGPPVSQGVRSVSWSGGSLSNANYDEFVFVAYLAPDAAPKTLYFPTLQTCGTLTSDWNEIPGAATPKPAHPAPGLKLAAAADAGAVAKAGDLAVATPWSRATPGGAKVAGGYLTVTNGGTTPDRLTGGTFAQAGRVEIHEMAMKDGVMTMRPLADGLEIPPGASVSFAPGGYHLMFFDLKQPLKEGDSVKGTLTFQKAGTVDVTFDVRGIGAGAPSSAPAAGGHGEHKH
ncbi:DUF1775 domain-containing protein [Aquabacter cavernae]|uniref:DUF1775 domain-containing protein n=1 Tax=Aquabacter cavernae TaxID=2496029 RepID=UPI000F8C4E6E|nr:DUF1775 domain-containing protein [Aquabacter cavernae]